MKGKKEKKTCLQIEQSHALLPHVLISLLKFTKVPALFISSSRVFHRRLPLNEREFSPYLFVCTCGSLHSALLRTL